MPIPTLLEEIRHTNRAYSDFPRHNGDSRAILARKLEVSYWRRKTLDRLLEDEEGRWADPGELARAVLELRLHLEPDHLSRLRGILADDDLYGRVAAQQGIRFPTTPQHHLLAGPGMDLKIQANRDSPWPMAKWQEIAAFSEYSFQGDTIHYRGLELQAGDVILANVNLDGNLVYSALSDPKSIFTHSAVLVVLKKGGRRFPAVVETYEKGVRAVPLAVFLNARFLAHAEVFRHREIGPEHGEALEKSAVGMIRDTRGYNFDSWEDDRSYLSCTAVGRFLLSDAGVDGIEPRSAIIAPQIVKNLTRLGYLTLDPVFTPGDYLLNPKFRLVGVVDNNQLHRLVARELVEHRFRTAFEKVDLDPALLPASYRINRFALGHIRRQSPLGRIIGGVIGFDHLNLPKGPDSVIAGIQPAEHQFAKAVKKLVPEVQAHLETMGAFSLQEMLADSRIQDLLHRLVSPRWLVS